MAVDLGRWKPDLHPRDSKGRFRDKWGLSPRAMQAVDRLLASFSPPPLRTDQHAASFLRGQKGPRSVKQKAALQRFLTREGNENVQSTLRAGDEPTPDIRELDGMMRPLQHDLIVSRVMGPDAFGLAPEQMPGVEEWTGKLVQDAGFSPTNVGNAYPITGPHVEMRILVPRGTRAIVVGDDGGPTEARTVILDREQPLRLGKIQQDERGGWYVLATVMPKQGAGKKEPPQGLGRKLEAKDMSPAIEATPEELQRRGVGPDEGVPGQAPQPERFGPAQGGGTGERQLPGQQQPVQSIPNPASSGTGKSAQQIQEAGGEIPVGAGGQGPATPRKKATREIGAVPDDAATARSAQREAAARDRAEKAREERRVAAEKVLAEREARLAKREEVVAQQDAASREQLTKANDSLSKTVEQQSALIDRLMGQEQPQQSSEGGTRAEGLTRPQKRAVVSRAKQIGTQKGEENDRIRDLARQIEASGEDLNAPETPAPAKKAAKAAAPEAAPEPGPGADIDADFVAGLTDAERRSLADYRAKNVEKLKPAEQSDVRALSVERDEVYWARRQAGATHAQAMAGLPIDKSFVDGLTDAERRNLANYRADNLGDLTPLQQNDLQNLNAEQEEIYWARRQAGYTHPRAMRGLLESRTPGGRGTRLRPTKRVNRVGSSIRGKDFGELRAGDEVDVPTRGRGVERKTVRVVDEDGNIHFTDGSTHPADGRAVKVRSQGELRASPTALAREKKEADRAARNMPLNDAIAAYDRGDITQDQVLENVGNKLIDLRKLELGFDIPREEGDNRPVVPESVRRNIRQAIKDLEKFRDEVSSGERGGGKREEAPEAKAQKVAVKRAARKALAESGEAMPAKRAAKKAAPAGPELVPDTDPDAGRVNAVRQAKSLMDINRLAQENGVRIPSTIGRREDRRQFLENAVKIKPGEDFDAYEARMQELKAPKPRGRGRPQKVLTAPPAEAPAATPAKRVRLAKKAAAPEAAPAKPAPDRRRRQINREEAYDQAIANGDAAEALRLWREDEADGGNPNPSTRVVAGRKALITRQIKRTEAKAAPAPAKKATTRATPEAAPAKRAVSRAPSKKAPAEFKRERLEAMGPRARKQVDALQAPGQEEYFRRLQAGESHTAALRHAEVEDSKVKDRLTVERVARYTPESVANNTPSQRRAIAKYAAEHEDELNARQAAQVRKLRDSSKEAYWQRRMDGGEHADSIQALDSVAPESRATKKATTKAAVKAPAKKTTIKAAPVKKAAPEKPVIKRAAAKKAEPAKKVLPQAPNHEFEEDDTVSVAGRRGTGTVSEILPNGKVRVEFTRRLNRTDRREDSIPMDREKLTLVRKGNKDKDLADLFAGGMDLAEAQREADRRDRAAKKAAKVAAAPAPRARRRGVPEEQLQPAKKTTARAAKKAAPEKAAPAKKAAVKKAAPAKAPVKKAAPAKAAPAKKAAVKKAAPAKAPVKKAAPVKAVEPAKKTTVRKAPAKAPAKVAKATPAKAPVKKAAPQKPVITRATPVSKMDDEAVLAEAGNIKGEPSTPRERAIARKAATINARRQREAPAPRAPRKTAAKAAPAKKAAAPRQTAADRAQTEKIGAALHAQWQTTQAEDPNGALGRKAKMKPTSDQNWIDAHGGATEVDIANTKFEDLPEDWQRENRDAAAVVQRILKQRGLDLDLTDEKTRQEVGEEIHAAWLSRENNAYAKGGPLDVPFKDLPRVEQDRDTDQIAVAQRALARPVKVTRAGAKAAPAKAAAKVTPTKAAPEPRLTALQLKDLEQNATYGFHNTKITRGKNAAANKRLDRLVELGYMEQTNAGSGEPPTYRITDAGRRRVGQTPRSGTPETPEVAKTAPAAKKVAAAKKVTAPEPEAPAAAEEVTDTSGGKRFYERGEMTNRDRATLLRRVRAAGNQRQAEQVLEDTVNRTVMQEIAAENPGLNIDPNQTVADLRKEMARKIRSVPDFRARRRGVEGLPEKRAPRVVQPESPAADAAVKAVLDRLDPETRQGVLDSMTPDQRRLVDAAIERRNARLEAGRAARAAKAAPPPPAKKARVAKKAAAPENEGVARRRRTDREAAYDQAIADGDRLKAFKLWREDYRETHNGETPPADLLRNRREAIDRAIGKRVPAKAETRRVQVKRGGKAITAAEARHESAIEAIRDNEISGGEAGSYNNILRNVQSGDWSAARGRAEAVQAEKYWREQGRKARGFGRSSPAERKRIEKQHNDTADKYRKLADAISKSQSKDEVDRRRFKVEPVPAKKAVRKAAPRPVRTEEQHLAEDRATREYMQPFLDQAGVDFDGLSDMDRTGLMVVGDQLRSGRISRAEAVRRLQSNRRGSKLNAVATAIGSPRTKATKKTAKAAKVATPEAPTKRQRMAKAAPEVPAKKAAPERPVIKRAAAKKAAAKAIPAGPKLNENRRAPEDLRELEGSLTPDEVAQVNDLTDESAAKYWAARRRGAGHETAWRSVPKGSIEDIRRASQPPGEEGTRPQGTGNIEELRRPSAQFERRNITRPGGRQRLTEEEKDAVIAEARANPDDRDLVREAAEIQMARDATNRAAKKAEPKKVVKKVAERTTKTRDRRSEQYARSIEGLLPEMEKRDKRDSALARSAVEDLRKGEPATSVKERLEHRAEFHRDSAEIISRQPEVDRIDRQQIEEHLRLAELYDQAAGNAKKKVARIKGQHARGAKIPVVDLEDGDVAVLDGKRGIYRNPKPRTTFIQFPDGTQEKVQKTKLAGMVREKRLQLLGGEHRPEKVEAPAKATKKVALKRAPASAAAVAPGNAADRRRLVVVNDTDGSVKARADQLVREDGKTSPAAWRQALDEAEAKQQLPEKRAAMRKVAGRTTPAKKAPAKKVAKAPAKKTATKAPAKKAPAKRTVKKVPAPRALRRGVPGLEEQPTPENDSPLQIGRDMREGRINRDQAVKRLLALGGRRERREARARDREQIRNAEPNPEVRQRETLRERVQRFRNEREQRRQEREAQREQRATRRQEIREEAGLPVQLKIQDEAEARGINTSNRDIRRAFRGGNDPASQRRRARTLEQMADNDRRRAEILDGGTDEPGAESRRLRVDAADKDRAAALLRERAAGPMRARRRGTAEAPAPAKKVAKAAPAKKAPAKKAVAKKAPPTKVAKAAPAKKAVPEKPTITRAAAKKAAPTKAVWKASPGTGIGADTTNYDSDLGRITKFPPINPGEKVSYRAYKKDLGGKASFPTLKAAKDWMEGRDTTTPGEFEPGQPGYKRPPKAKRHHVSETERITSLRESAEGGTTRVRRLGGGADGGNVNDVALVRDANGKQLIRKEMRQDAHLDPERQADAENLNARLAEGMGVDAPATFQSGPDTVFQERIEGRLASKISEDRLQKLLDTPEGRRIHLMDLITGNPDRHDGNMMVGKDGKLYAIDHGMSFADGFTDRGPDGDIRPVPPSAHDPFRRLLKATTGTYTRGGAARDDYQWADEVPFTRAEVMEARRQLVKMRPEFTRAGRQQWYKDSLERADALLKRSQPNPRAARKVAQAAEAAPELRAGSRVRNADGAVGRVTRVNGDRASVRWDNGVLTRGNRVDSLTPESAPTKKVAKAAPAVEKKASPAPKAAKPSAAEARRARREQQGKDAGLTDGAAKRFADSPLTMTSWKKYHATNSTPDREPAATPPNPESKWGKVRDNPRVQWAPTHGRPGYADQADRVYTASSDAEAKRFLWTRDDRQLENIADEGDVSLRGLDLNDPKDRSEAIDRVVKGIREPEGSPQPGGPEARAAKKAAKVAPAKAVAKPGSAPAKAAKKATPGKAPSTPYPVKQTKVEDLKVGDVLEPDQSPGSMPRELIGTGHITDIRQDGLDGYLVTVNWGNGQGGGQIQRYKRGDLLNVSAPNEAPGDMDTKETAPTKKAPSRQKHEIKLPDGTIATRTSDRRSYTHAVVVTKNNHKEADRLERIADLNAQARKDYEEAVRTGDWSKFERVGDGGNSRHRHWAMRWKQPRGEGEGSEIRFPSALPKDMEADQRDWQRSYDEFEARDKKWNAEHPERQMPLTKRPWYSEHDLTPEEYRRRQVEGALKANKEYGDDRLRSDAKKLRERPEEEYYVSRWSSSRANAERALSSREVKPDASTYKARVVEVGTDMSGGKETGGTRAGVARGGAPEAKAVPAKKAPAAKKAEPSAPGEKAPEKPTITRAAEKKAAPSIREMQAETEAKNAAAREESLRTRDGIPPTDGRPDVTDVATRLSKDDYHRWQLGSSQGRKREYAPDVARVGGGWIDNRQARAELLNPKDGKGNFRWRIYDERNGDLIEEGESGNATEAFHAADRIFSSQRNGGMARSRGKSARFEARQVERPKDRSRGDVGKGPFYEHQVVEIDQDGNEKVRIRTGSMDRAEKQAAELNTKEELAQRAARAATRSPAKKAAVKKAPAAKAAEPEAKPELSDLEKRRRARLTPAQQKQLDKLTPEEQQTYWQTRERGFRSSHAQGLESARYKTKIDKGLQDVKDADSYEAARASLEKYSDADLRAMYNRNNGGASYHVKREQLVNGIVNSNIGEAARKKSMAERRGRQDAVISVVKEFNDEKIDRPTLIQRLKDLDTSESRSLADDMEKSKNLEPADFKDLRAGDTVLDFDNKEVDVAEVRDGVPYDADGKAIRPMPFARNTIVRARGSGPEPTPAKAAKPKVLRQAPRIDTVKKNLLAAPEDERMAILDAMNDDMTLPKWRRMAREMGAGEYPYTRQQAKDAILRVTAEGKLGIPKKGLRDQLRDADVNLGGRDNTVDKLLGVTNHNDVAELRDAARRLDEGAAMYRGMADRNEKDSPAHARNLRDEADDFEKAAKVFRSRADSIEKGQAKETRKPETDRPAPEVVPTMAESPEPAPTTGATTRGRTKFSPSQIDMLRRLQGGDLSQDDVNGLSTQEKRDLNRLITHGLAHKTTGTIDGKKQFRTRISDEGHKELAKVDAPARPVKVTKAAPAKAIETERAEVAPRVTAPPRVANKTQGERDQLAREKRYDDAIARGDAEGALQAWREDQDTEPSAEILNARRRLIARQIRRQQPGSAAVPTSAGKKADVGPPPKEDVALTRNPEGDNMRMHGDSVTMRLAQDYAAANRNGSANRMMELRRRSTTPGDDGISPQQTIDELRAIRAQETDPRFQEKLDSAIESLDAPMTPMPDLPENLGPEARKLIEDLHAIPLARKGDGDKFPGGTIHGPSLVDQVAQVYRDAANGERPNGQSPDMRLRSILRNQTHEMNEPAFRLWSMSERAEPQPDPRRRGTNVASPLMKEMRELGHSAPSQRGGAPEGPAKEVKAVSQDLSPRADADRLDVARARLEGREGRRGNARKTERIEHAKGAGMLAANVLATMRDHRGDDNDPEFRRAIDQDLKGDIVSEGPRDQLSKGAEAFKKAMEGSDSLGRTGIEERLRETLDRMGMKVEHDRGDVVPFDPDTMSGPMTRVMQRGEPARVTRSGVSYRDEDGTVHPVVLTRVTRDNGGGGNPLGEGPRPVPPPRRRVRELPRTATTEPETSTPSRVLTGQQGRDTSDMGIDADTGPDGLPVRDYSLASGYKVGHGTVYRVNGTNYLVEHPDTPDGRARAKRIQEALQLHKEKLPRSKRRFARSYAWVEGRRPEDGAVDPRFVAEAESDNLGGVTLYARSQFGTDNLGRTLDHEFAHTVEHAESDSKRDAHSPRWRRAAKLDAGHRTTLHDVQVDSQLTPGDEIRTSSLKRVPGVIDFPDGVTNYGSSTAGEDWAEAFMLWRAGPIGTGRLTEGGPVVPIWFRDLYPHRAAIFDESMESDGLDQLDEIRRIRGLSPTKQMDAARSALRAQYVDSPRAKAIKAIGPRQRRRGLDLSPEDQAFVDRFIADETAREAETRKAGIATGTVGHGKSVTTMLPEDIGPDGVEVRDLRFDQHEYHMKQGHAWRFGGDTYVVEGSDPVRARQQMEGVRREVERMPPELRQHQKAYVVFDEYSPASRRRRKELGLDDSYEAFGSAAIDAGDIAFWGRGDKDFLENDPQFRATLRHEASHNADAAMGNASLTKRYIKATELGTANSTVRSFRQRKVKGQGTLRPPTGKGKFPNGINDYATTSPREDWAESAEYYFGNDEFGGIIGTGVLTPGGPRVPIWFRDLFPARAAVFDRYFPEFARQQLAEMRRERGFVSA